MATMASVPAAHQTRYADNVYFQDGKALTGVLASLLYLLVAVSLDAAGYVENMTLLAPVTYGALLLGFFMAYSRFDGFLALSHSMFTGLAWILYLMSGTVSRAEVAPFLSNGIPEKQAEAYFVLLRWLNWVDAAINDVASADNYVFIFEMSFLVWWLTYLGIWSIFRYGYTWRAVIPAGAVLLVNTYYAPSSILGFLIVFVLVGLLLLVRTNLAEQQLRWREQRIHYNQDISWDFLRQGLYYSMIVLALAWIVPGLGRSAQVRTVLAPVNQQWEAASERMNRLYQGINRQTRPVAAAFGRTLSLGGAREVTDDYVFRVDAPIGRYWRAVVYDTYTGRQWLSTAEEEMAFEAGESVPIAEWEMRQPLTQTITLLGPASNVLLGAPDIVQASVPMDAVVRSLSAPEAEAEGNGPALPVEVSIARTDRGFESGDQYTVVSSNTSVTELALRNASVDYPPHIVERYLQLPDNFSQRVAEDARVVTADAETVYDKARALELRLRTIEYNDAIEAPPPERDPVEYFLYDIRQGYCDYYATSMAVMLRSVGIPARVVSGYAEGSYIQEGEYQGFGYYFITERDAHTWVEVFFPEYGWIEFEPTAGETQLNRPRGNEATSQEFPSYPQPGADSASSNPLQEEMFDPMDEPGVFGDEFSFGEEASALAHSWWLWALVTPLALAVGLWVIWRTRVAGPSQFDPNLPPILYERLQRWAARLGLRPPESDTPYEQARHLSQAVPEGRASIRAITEVYVRYRFGGQRWATDGASTERARGAALADWQSLQPVLWRAWFNKLLGRRKPAEPNHYQLVDK